MAGDWIKFEAATPDKPEVWAIAEGLNIDPDAVVGKLLRVWIWFDQHTETGNAPSVSKLTLDRLVGVSGFAKAMIFYGWMIEKNDEITLPHFERHNGKTAKNRALTAKRVAKHSANAKLTVAALPKEEQRRVKEKDPSGLKRKTMVPENFSPNEKTRAWFKTQGFGFSLDDMVAEYVDGCQAGGYKYVNHDSAFRNWSKKRHGNNQRPGRKSAAQQFHETCVEYAAGDASSMGGGTVLQNAGEIRPQVDDELPRPRIASVSDD